MEIRGIIITSDRVAFFCKLEKKWGKFYWVDERPNLVNLNRLKKLEGERYCFIEEKECIRYESTYYTKFEERHLDNFIKKEGLVAFLKQNGVDLDEY